MNSRTLKRRLREYELRKRNEVHSELEVREIIKREIESSSLLLGYRFNKLQVGTIEIRAFLQPNTVSIAMNVLFNVGNYTVM